MMFCMIHNMQFRMLKTEGALTQSQNSVSFVSARVEEAFKKVEKHVLDYDKQNQLIIQNTQSITESKFNDLTNTLLGETMKLTI